MTLEPMKQKTGKNSEYASGYSAEKTVETIKNIADNIRYYSAMTRLTSKTLRESGAITDLAGAIREASAAARDTAKDIRQTAAELNENGTISDTVRAVKETKRAAQDTVHTVMDATQHAKHQLK